MASILKNIINCKKKEVERAKKNLPFDKLLELIKKSKIKTRDFKKAISGKTGISCIGELKKASPSKGIIRRNLNLIRTARIYQNAGIKALSVLTDKHFSGKLEDIKKVKRAVNIPILRKDFIINSYQIYESYLAGADAILLIASILKREKLNDFLNIAKALRLSAIVEIHDLRDVKKIDFAKTKIIGINNRNLKDFKTDLKTTERLAKKIPQNIIIVSESGINSKNDINFLGKSGVNVFLIGESIVSAKNIKKKIESLL